MSNAFMRPLVLVLLLLSALVAGCASRPEGVLIPVSADISASDKVDLLVATTRAPSPVPGVLFSGERGSALSIENIVVSIPKNRRVGEVNWPRRVPGDPSRDFVVTKATPLKRDEVTTWFNRLPGKPRRVLIFVHGFNTPFDASVFRFAQIVHDTDADLAPVLFSWPSRGSVLDYNYDRESTNFSRSDLAYVIRAAAASRKVTEVVVMAHSMGAWVTVEALRDLSLQKGGVPNKVTNLVLASPDLDFDVFRKQLQEIGPRRPHITIFVSANDRALRVSRLLAGRVTRVGAVDLTQEPYKSQFEKATGVTVLDLSALRNGDRLNHSQFATSPEVVQILGDRLIRGQIVSDADAPAGQLGAGAVGAGQVLGSAAGAVLSAPILIFEAGRRN